MDFCLRGKFGCKVKEGKRTELNLKWCVQELNNEKGLDSQRKEGGLEFYTKFYGSYRTHPGGRRVSTNTLEPVTKFLL